MNKRKYESYYDSDIMRVVKAMCKNHLEVNAEDNDIDKIINTTMRFLNDCSWLIYGKFVVDEVVDDTNKIYEEMRQVEEDYERVSNRN